MHFLLQAETPKNNDPFAPGGTAITAQNDPGKARLYVLNLLQYEEESFTTYPGKIIINMFNYVNTLMRKQGHCLEMYVNVDCLSEDDSQSDLRELRYHDLSCGT